MSGRAGDGDFLSRWSRRKREVVEGRGQNDVTEAPNPLPPACGGEGIGMGGREAGLDPSSPAPSGTAPHPTLLPTASGGRAERGSAQSEPEIEPPSLDLVDKDFDIAHWLKQNVPESWKLAALRRAWLADPAIRDYQNPARDYALDWNTPGGAPGYGPLSESDDVEAMIRKIFGEPPEKPVTEATEAAGDSMPHLAVPAGEGAESHGAEQQKALLAHEDALPSPERNRENSPDQGAKAAKSSEPALAALQNQAKQAGPPLRIRKRGGGAMPI